MSSAVSCSTFDHPGMPSTTTPGPSPAALPGVLARVLCRRPADRNPTVVGGGRIVARAPFVHSQTSAGTAVDRQLLVCIASQQTENSSTSAWRNP
jgi:hypothetical protein